MGMIIKCAFILYTFNYDINIMVYFYYLKFKVVSSSKDALIVNNIILMATVNIMNFLVLIRKMMYCM